MRELTCYNTGMLDIFSFAVGLHTRDRMLGVVLWDVDYFELTEQRRWQYMKEAKEIIQTLQSTNLWKSEFPYLRKRYNRE